MPIRPPVKVQSTRRGVTAVGRARRTADPVRLPAATLASAVMMPPGFLAPHADPPARAPAGFIAGFAPASQRADATLRLSGMVVAQSERRLGDQLSRPLGTFLFSLSSFMP